MAGGKVWWSRWGARVYALKRGTVELHSAHSSQGLCWREERRDSERKTGPASSGRGHTKTDPRQEHPA